jgi:hypothetical protein
VCTNSSHALVSRTHRNKASPGCGPSHWRQLRWRQHHLSGANSGGGQGMHPTNFASKSVLIDALFPCEAPTQVAKACHQLIDALSHRNILSNHALVTSHPTMPKHLIQPCLGHMQRHALCPCHQRMSSRFHVTNACHRLIETIETRHSWSHGIEIIQTRHSEVHVTNACHRLIETRHRPQGS